MKKRVLCLILAVAMTVSIFTVLTACNNEPAPPAATPTPTPVPEVVTPPENPEVPELPDHEYDGTGNLVIAPDGLEITVFYTHGGNGTILPDQLIFQAAEEITGVRINNIANPNMADEQEALTEMMLSGNFANLIFGNIGQISPLISEGLYMDISDLIYNYAPNIVRYFNAIPATQIASTYHDGGIYFLRSALVGSDAASEQPSKLWFIRHDWLADLGLPLPTTLAEYRDALYAFKEAEIAGPDTIPFFARQADIRTLVQLWGVQGDWANWFIDKDGKVGFGQFSEEYKVALIELAQWYADGIIDQEIFTRGGNARAELLSQNNGGAAVDWPGSTGALNFNEDIRANAPEMDWGIFRMPRNINGELRSEWGRGSVTGFGWGVHRDVDPELALAIVRFMDFWFTDEGALLATYGVEGESFNFIDGQPTFIPEAFEHEGGIPFYMRTLGIQEFPKWPADISFEIGNFAERTQIGYMDALENVLTISPFPPLSLLPAEQAMLDRISDLGGLTDEFRMGAIMGTIDVEAEWDSYIDQARHMGVFDAMQAYQQAYDRFVATLR